jgi:hypothetical protein
MPEERRRNVRSWFAAITLTFASFMATLGALAMPVVEGATARRLKEMPKAEEPLVVASRPMQPVVKITSKPAGAAVFDASWELVGRTPLQVRSPDGSWSGEFILSHDGFADKRLSVTFENQSVVAVMAHAEKNPKHGQRR